MGIYNYFETRFSILRYNFSSYRRYSNILKIILNIKPSKIIEIGVYKGKRSIEMIKAAKSFNSKISFYGFDLFEMFYEKKDMIGKEFSKYPSNKIIIKEILKKHADVNLIKGNTLKTLPKFKKKNKFDFIFIDGGHSLKTIKNDWKYMKKFMHKNSVVVFDDYYLGDKNIIKKFGCNKLIENLSKDYQVSFLEPKDYIPSSKIYVQLVKVELRK